MKINDLLYKTPEMTEEKLLEIMDSHIDWLKKDFKKRIHQLHKNEPSLSKAILNEYDLVQDKQSLLTHSQRNIVVGFTGMCMIEMTKGEEHGEH